jgi:hypothetical protein
MNPSLLKVIGEMNENLDWAFSGYAETTEIRRNFIFSPLMISTTKLLQNGNSSVFVAPSRAVERFREFENEFLIQSAVLAVDALRVLCDPFQRVLLQMRNQHCHRLCRISFIAIGDMHEPVLAFRRFVPRHQFQFLGIKVVWMVRMRIAVIVLFVVPNRCRHTSAQDVISLGKR